MALTLKDLTEEERLALVALMEGAIEADRHASDPEIAQVRATVAALGKKAYKAAAEESDRRFKDDAALWRFLATIDRQEARELIYETVLEAVLADAQVGEESELLKRLSRLWDISVQVVDRPE